MLEKRVVYKGKTKKGLRILVRYPCMDDVEAMRNYINTLSKEQTFIRFQGESQTHTQERKFVRAILDGLKNNTIVYLLAFHGDELIGSSQVEMKDKAQKHVGLFGISIAKAYRNQGIGKLLMSLVFSEAKLHLPQMRICVLETFAENSVARRMYEQCGFQVYGQLPKGLRRKNRYDDDVYMYKNIAWQGNS
ncbi:MAG: GNAT family protein [bacterium]|nr:GNAT family protein [bacterium]